LSREKTPIEMAKEKIGALFGVLAFDRDATWRELVRGGWECRTSLVSRSLRGYVSSDGYYTAEVVDKNGACYTTLMSGSYADFGKMQGYADDGSGGGDSGYGGKL